MKDKEILGHSPALGCGGLADVGSKIYMVPTQPKSKCDDQTIAKNISKQDQVWSHFAEQSHKDYGFPFHIWLETLSYY